MATEISDPLLSVCLITYNHAKYIEQAIEGALSQEIDFPWEFVIADDCSTDGTTEIVRRYAEQHPDVIRPILQNPNVGPAENFVQLLKAAKGKYIAYFEGDDYWTDPRKLKKQVDFLEANPDFAICFHAVEKHYADESRPPKRTNVGQKEVTEFEDLAWRNYIYTASCCFRNRLFKGFPEWYKDAPAGDWILHLLNAQFGKIKYIDEVMAVYRVHKGGIWSMRPDDEKSERVRQVFKKCYSEFYPRSERTFRKLIARTVSDQCFYSYERGDYREFRSRFANYMRHTRPLNMATVAALSLRFLRSLLPSQLSRTR